MFRSFKLTARGLFVFAVIQGVPNAVFHCLGARYNSACLFGFLSYLGVWAFPSGLTIAMSYVLLGLQFGLVARVVRARPAFPVTHQLGVLMFKEQATGQVVGVLDLGVGMVTLDDQPAAMLRRDRVALLVIR